MAVIRPFFSIRPSEEKADKIAALPYDVYSREEPSSPIARIKGGLGMNEKGEVLIFDGVDTIYGVPFLSMDETYANGKEFLNGEVRYNSLKRANLAKAERLFGKNEQEAKDRYTYLNKLVKLYGAEEE